MKVLMMAVVWALAAVGSSAQGLDEAMPGILKDAGVASVSLAEIVDGRVVLAKAYGEQSAGVPATDKTLYNIASMTKPVTAEVVLRLVAAGKVGLDEPMYKFWVDPDIAKDERSKVLTPRMALSHQMGFANWRRMTGGVLAFQHEPGTYGYSGEGYQYVARFVEKKTGRRFEDLAQEMVFEPAGMKETAYTGRPWFAGRIAVPVDGKGKALTPVIAKEYVAADLIYTTASDYGRFMVSVMQHQGVSEAVFRERMKVQILTPDAHCGGCPAGIGFGLGWQVIPVGTQTYLMHTGKDEGVATLGYMNLATKSGVVILTNSDDGMKTVLPILDRLGRDKEFVAVLREMAK